MKIETMEDLFYEELRELYDEEERLVQALPKMAKNSSSERLREAFRQHADETKTHVTRLEDCFRDLDRDADKETADAMKGLIKDGERVIDDIDMSPLRDVGLIAAAKRVEHYEMASYAAAISFARLLGHEKIAGLLEQTLREERETDSRLTRLADEIVDQEALQLGVSQRR